MRLKSIILLLWCTFSCTAAAWSQFKLYESTFNGGVVTGGYSNGATVPSGSGSFNVSIPSGSTIRRAYLIAGRCGNAPAVTVTLNGTPFTFNAGNAMTNGFQTIYGGSSGVHAIDVTASISASTSSYTIAVPAQNTVSDKYPEFYLYIAFDNGLLPAISSVIYLNTNNLNTSTFAWALNTVQPVVNSSPVGLGLLGGYAAVSPDCENVTVNGTAIGSFGGQDFNASSQWGSMSGFQYYNNSLSGYNDDNGNQAMNGVDALSNIQALIPGSTNNINVNFSHCGGGSDNHVWALFLTYAGVILDGRAPDFQAEPGQDQVHLAWQTSDETGMANFELLRSFDSQTWETIGSKIAFGDAQPHAYTWADESPRQGSNWYRLRTIGADGLAQLSEIREVQFDGLHSLAIGVSPNPMQRGDQLQLKLLSTESVEYTLYGLADSREIARGHLAGNLSPSLPTQDLAPGPYGIQLKQGGKIQVLKFFIQ